MEDLIKRSDAIKNIEMWLDNDGEMFDVGLKQAIREIKRLPSADRPQGEWVADENGECRCSVCGVREERFIYGLGEYWHGRGESNFCPNCGADMRKGVEDEAD